MILPVEEMPQITNRASRRGCLPLAMISSVYSPNLSDGRAVAVTAQSHKTAEEEYEEQVRILVRIVSSCTLGLFAFAAGLLIGTFLFS